MGADRLAALRKSLDARARQPIAAGLLRLVLGGSPCGWVEPAAAACLLADSTEFECDGGVLRPAGDPLGIDDCTALLGRAACRLRDNGLAPHWRNEQLDVLSDRGARLATIERGACRVLGITTYSVHLNAIDSMGRVVAARRALHKPSDPGLWDSLAGGMVAAGESLTMALQREAMEEAGLDMDRLVLAGHGPRQRRAYLVQRPVAEGLMIEQLAVFDVRLPEGFEPVNADGEVSAFHRFLISELLPALERGEFTLEASLATLEALQHVRLA
jgi:8-oxo-dGTP pyrophosphatase MutT (NUDIX family)